MLPKFRNALAAILASLCIATPAAAAEPTGQWLTGGGLSRVQIARCGPGLCGTVVWLKDPNGEDGKPKLDIRNNDAAQHKRPIIGLTVLSGMTANGAASWRGRIYNPEDGNSYDASMTLQGDNALDVAGCALRIICKHQTWTRVR